MKKLKQLKRETKILEKQLLNKIIQFQIIQQLKQLFGDQNNDAIN